MDVNIRLDNLELHKSCMNTRDCNNRRALVRVIINELERSLVSYVPCVNGSRFFKRLCEIDNEISIVRR